MGFILLTALPVGVEAQEIRLTTSQGSGWILLDLKDLNERLSQAGYPTLSETAQMKNRPTSPMWDEQVPEIHFGYQVE